MTRLRLLSLIAVLAVLITLAPMPASADVTTMAGNFVGQYWNNMTLSGAPVVTRTDATINFYWNGTSPDPAIPVTNFSARWTGTVSFAVAGTYQFSATCDDGCRLWVDGLLLIDKWFDQPATTYTVNVYIVAGAHNVRMDYYQNLGAAVAVLAWGMTGPSSGFLGEYYANMTLAGSPVLQQVTPSVNYNWGSGSPAPTVPVDYFSARWTGVFNFDTAGNYLFTMTTDDGSRLWLDGLLIIDAWYPQAANPHTTTRSVSAGPHEMRMEYFEEIGLASAVLTWSLSGGGGGGGTPGSEVVIDDLDPGFTRGGPTGAWKEAGIGYLNHIFWTKNTTSVQENWGRWTPTLPAAGQYEVFVYMPNNYANTHNARYSIKHNALWNTVAINQALYFNCWVTLGTYYFSAGGDEFVFLPDTTYEPRYRKYIGYDAAKLVYRGP